MEFAFTNVIQSAGTSAVFHLPEGHLFKGEKIAVPIRYELLLNARQTREEKYATLVHELGHLYCGHLGSPNEQHWPDRRGWSKEVVECEAESVSYLVCARLGIETQSAQYLADYLSGDGKVPSISLDAVLKSAMAIHQMGKALLPLRKD